MAKHDLAFFIERAEKSKEDKYKIKIYESKMVGELEVVKMGIKKITEIMDSFSDDDNTSKSMRNNAMIIYESVPLLRRKELREAYGVSDPYDIVYPFFEENIEEINNLVSFIFKMHGIIPDKKEKNESVVDEIKN